MLVSEIVRSQECYIRRFAQFVTICTISKNEKNTNGGALLLAKLQVCTNKCYQILQSITYSRSMTFYENLSNRNMLQVAKMRAIKIFRAAGKYDRVNSKDTTTTPNLS